MYKFFLCFESMNYSKFIKIKKKWCSVSLHGEVFQLPAIKCFKTCFLAHRSTWASPGLNGIKDTWGCRCNTPDLVFCRSNQSVFLLNLKLIQGWYMFIWMQGKKKWPFHWFCTFFLILIPGQSNWDGSLGSFYVSLHACLIYLLTLPRKKNLRECLKLW